MRKPIVSASILLGITSPFTAYQDVYGPLPIGARVFVIGLSLGAVAYYLRSDIVRVLNTAQQQIAKYPDDLSQDKLLFGLVGSVEAVLFPADFSNAETNGPDSATETYAEVAEQPSF
jgi:hypothetical protein